MLNNFWPNPYGQISIEKALECFVAISDFATLYQFTISFETQTLSEQSLSHDLTITRLKYLIDNNLISCIKTDICLYDSLSSYEGNHIHTAMNLSNWYKITFKGLWYLHTQNIKKNICQ